MIDPLTQTRPGQPLEGPLRELLKVVYLRDLTGTLEVEMAGEIRRFYFLQGDLYLVDGHALAKRLAALLGGGESESPESPPGSAKVAAPARPVPPMSPEARQDLWALVTRIAGFLVQLEVGKARFQQGRDEHPENLVGPLSTGLLVMEMAVLGLDGDEILRRLGGLQTKIVSQSDGSGLEEHDWLGLEEVFLLSRLEVPMVVGDVLTSMGLDREAALRAIERLRSLDLISLPGGADTVSRSPVGPQRLVSEEVLTRFKERIADVLEKRPVVLDYDEHREALRNLLATLGEKDHYQLLDLRRDAKVEQVHTQYEELASLVHPAHARRLELTGREQALELIFEKATEAYLTLSDPKRRASYDQHMGFSILDEEDEDAEIRHRDLAREYFQMARRLVESQQYHAAHELLRDAARRDSRPEYWGLLAQVQAKNPNWLRRAVESYRKAVELAPGSVELRLGLALTCEQANYVSEAKTQFEEVLGRMPGHPAATAGLDRIAGIKEKGKASGGGFLRRLFGRGGDS